ncbi:hypothetical protein ACFRI7_17135 [Streptomyces sp. NPDC056716]|uniref:hypothetical protein n=1 Tax=Streptomyces sp. NPDC056716 TaxID=3345922 RepID=UPI0036C59F34
MNAGTPPAPGTSRMTIETYRIRAADGERVDRTRTRVYRPGPGPLTLADTLRWPPCHCPRCRTGDRPPGAW